MTTFDNERFADSVVPANDAKSSDAEYRDGGVANPWAPPDADRVLRQEQLVAHYLNDLGDRIDDDYVELVERLDDLTERVLQLEAALAGTGEHACGERLDEIERAIDEFASRDAASARVGGTAGPEHGLPIPENAASPRPVEADDPMARLALSLAEPGVTAAAQGHDDDGPRPSGLLSHGHETTHAVGDDVRVSE